MATGSSESRTWDWGEPRTGDSRTAAGTCLQAAGSRGAKGCCNAVLAGTAGHDLYV